MSRRRFNGRERNLLYIQSNGKCEKCGIDLDNKN